MNPTTKATTRQTWAIFCATKYDVRNCQLTNAAASQIISEPDATRKLEMVRALKGAVLNGKEKKATDNFSAIWDEAHKAGMEAGEKCIPRPMLVGSPTLPLGNDIDPSKPVYFVPQGVCGFAWVKIRNGTCAFAKWARKNKGSRRGYYGGEEINVPYFNQSMEMKLAYAGAFAEVLNKHGIEAWGDSRMD